ncbi:alpha/beta fold hydrolase [Nonomuraea sp. B5E05]|uniref:alpha/beta hydrolase family protein n=1 Tax=Nonomuraea sp. B5E05 TaxID=3153569 RepID=UPI003260DA3A
MAQHFNRLRFSNDIGLDVHYLRILSGAPYGAASAGEVMNVASTMRARGGDRDIYIETWAELGRRIAAQAEEALAAGRRVTARAAHLRASTYLRAAEFFFPANRLEERRKVYEESLTQFDAAAELMPHPVEKVEIPYEDGVTLPGHVFTVTDDGRPRPTVVLCGGVDGSGEEMYLLGGIPDALARGLNVIVFHGPGQRGLQLSHPHLTFRPDYEVPLGAVVDHAVGRPDVDAERVALYGVSYGGYLAPRAAAHDRRVRALVANSPMRAPLGVIMGGAERAATGVAEQLDEAGWAGQAMVENYFMWNHGVSRLEEFAARVQAFTLDGLEEQITCPTLSLVAEGETDIATEQARRFHHALRAPKYFATLPAVDGADTHCGISNIPYTSAMAYDWLAEHLR